MLTHSPLGTTATSTLSGCSTLQSSTENPPYSLWSLFTRNSKWCGRGVRMEGGVPRGEEPDSEPKNFHLSKQAGESHGNSESNSERAPLCSQHREAEIPLTAAGRAKNTAHKGTQRLSNVCSNHELDGGQNTLIACPNTQKH